jgi:voltage-gated potassium channel
MEKEKIEFGFTDLIGIFLSIYVLIVLVFESFFHLPAETQKLLDYIDIFVCLFFFSDFTTGFIKANNKLSYMKWGWIDLVSSIPMVGVFRAGRVFRLIRLLRIVRAFKNIHQFLDYIFRNKAKGTLTMVGVFAFMLIIFSSIAILQVEDNPQSNIKTAEDAIWWSYVTITTVGYGDKFPVTMEGRMIASILMLAGISLFGTFTAYIASWFALPSPQKI